jgi:chromosome partitioning protein
MKSIRVANPKGGSGKSTVATNLAGWLARQSRRVMLGDIDRQQSSREWLRLRPATLPRIEGWQIEADQPARPPAGTTHAVLDTPAGLHGKKLRHMLTVIDRVLVPLQPSLFDILATREFLAALAEENQTRNDKHFVAIIGNRVDARTRAAGELARFLTDHNLPVLTYLRDTQNYVQAAAHGLTIFDLPASRAAQDWQQWQPVVDWVEGL